mgnify:FL=1
MGFRAGLSSATRGLQKVTDLGTVTALTLASRHTNTVFLCGGATQAITLPNANTLPNGWNVKFILNDETAAVTITGVADQCIGHVVTGHDNQNRQLQPTSAIRFEKIIFTGGAKLGDWVEIINLDSGLFHVRGDSRITDKITCTSP